VRVNRDGFAGWTPPAYTVDAGGKVVGARPGPRHNWARWGELDERGTANLLTPERVQQAAGLIRTGRRFSLGLPMGRGGPNPTTRPAAHHLFTRASGDHILGDPGPADVQSADDLVILPLQGSTQLDGHAHVGEDDVLYNGFWAGLVTATSGARRLGIQHQAEGIVGRGVLLDVARVHEIDPFETGIGPDMLDSTAASHGVEVGAGDIMLVRTGFLRTWLSEPETRRRRRQSGLTAATIDWLADRDVAMVAADNRTIEVIPRSGNGSALPFHVAALRDLGLLLGELFELEALAEACAGDGVYEFFFAAMPLPLVNAVGSPLNPVVIK
jgi:kynurenine formamidase